MIEDTGNPPVPDGYSRVPAGRLATIVTALEMRADPGHPAAEPLLLRVDAPATDWYRDLYRRIGEPWLWSSRLAMADERLAAILADPAVEVYTLRESGIDIALVELNFRVGGEAELAFFGLAPGATGRGLGGRLLREAIAMMWRPGIARIWVHTCTHDHPAALGLYRRAGFVPFASYVEVFGDPRLTGLLPRDAAPQTPFA